jgi:hypothetical protein
MKFCETRNARPEARSVLVSTTCRSSGRSATRCARSRCLAIVTPRDDPSRRRFGATRVSAQRAAPRLRRFLPVIVFRNGPDTRPWNASTVKPSALSSGQRSAATAAAGDRGHGPDVAELAGFGQVAHDAHREQRRAKPTAAEAQADGRAGSVRRPGYVVEP